MTWRELQRSAWGSIRWRAAGAFWAALAFFFSPLPHYLALARFSAAPGFLNHLVNLILSSQSMLAHPSSMTCPHFLDSYRPIRSSDPSPLLPWQRM